MEEEHQVFAKEELVDSFGFRHPFLPTFRLQSLIQQKKNNSSSVLVRFDVRRKHETVFSR